MLLAPSNFLLLGRTDEPSRHAAKDVLLESLRDIRHGLFVSHDPTSIDNLATRFRNRRRPRHVYPLNYEDYLWRTAAEHRRLWLKP